MVTQSPPLAGNDQAATDQNGPLGILIEPLESRSSLLIPEGIGTNQVLDLLNHDPINTRQCHLHKVQGTYIDRASYTIGIDRASYTIGSHQLT